MAILNKIQVKGVLYEIEDSNAIHGTLKTINGESLHGTGDIVTVGKATEQNGEVFNDYENNVANGTYSSAIGNSTIANNFAEHASGQFNVSNSGAEGKNNTLSSIGIGTSDDSRKNAFEVMKNGDLYVYGIGEYDGTNPIQTNSLQTIINQSLNDIESKVDKSTTINGKPLTSNIIINGTDIVVGGDSDYRTDSLADAFKKIDDFIGDAQSYAVTSFGGQTGDVTLQLDSETNGDVNFAMFNKELRGTVVGLKSAAYTEAQDYATAAQGLKADSAVQSVRESNTGTNISILASKTGNVINLTPSLTISTVSSNGTGLTTAKDVKSYVDTSINNLDKAAVTAGTGQVISSVSQSNGIVSASIKTLAEADIPTLSQSKISGLTASLNAKQNTITGAASTVATNNLAANRALVSDAGGKIAVSVVTSTELGYLDGVTSNIQTQLNAKANASALAGYALKDGSNASGTWPISISGIANRAVYLTSTYTGSGGLQPPSYFNGMGLKVNMMNAPVSYSDVIVVNGYGGAGSDVPYINAIGFQKTANAHGEVYHARGDYNGSSWGTWYKFLDEYNYTSYTVTKTGSGASGTWNINISGTAASANSVAWNNVSGKPSSFTPASHTHTASQVSGLARVATSGSYNDLINKPNIPEGTEVDAALSSTSVNPVQNKVITSALNGKANTSHTHSQYLTSSSLSGYATQSWVRQQGYLTTPYTLPTASASTLGGVKIGSGVNISSGVISVTTSSIGAATASHTHSQYLTSSSLSGYATQSWVNSQGFLKSATDTKNTAGSVETSSKLFLVGALSQAASSITYSNSSVYTRSGQLYASQMNATNGFFETSDARLKTFGGDVKSLDSLSKIPTKYFTWKLDENQKQHIGTSAQEVQKIYPELVSENETGELSVDYARLSIIALAAIKELKEEIEELKSKI